MANFAHDAIEQFKRLPAGGKIAVGIAFVAVAAIGYLEYSRSKNQPTTPAVDTTGATTSTDLTGTGATLPPTTNPPVTTTPPQPVSPGACPPGMHRGSTSGLCKCDGKNMINKGDHCIPKKGSKKSTGKSGGPEITATPYRVGHSGAYQIQRYHVNNEGHMMVATHATMPPFQDVGVRNIPTVKNHLRISPPQVR